MAKTLVTIKKRDKALQIVYGEVYAPNTPDSQGEFMSENTVRATAYNFMQSHRNNKVDTNHDNVINGSIIVESFIAREGDLDFIVGAWVVAIYIPDTSIWEKVLSNELNGLSIEATEILSTEPLYLQLPRTIKGTTEETEGHSHSFIVNFNDEGLYKGGSTGSNNSHTHIILNGTVTEESDGHKHRYNILDGGYALVTD